MTTQEEHYPSHCGCVLEAGCWGEGGFHHMVAPAGQPNAGRIIVYERCPAYVAAMKRARLKVVEE